MIDTFGYEYENRGNKKRCIIHDIDPSNVVYFRKLDNYSVVCKLPYNDFKRAWVKREPHKPYVGKVYRLRLNNSNLNFYPKFCFVVKITEHSNGDLAVVYNGLGTDKTTFEMCLPFNNLYELHQ